MLPVLKSHMRVEFSRDDPYITLIASRALDLFERITEWGVVTRVYDWVPGEGETGSDGTSWRWPAPVKPMTAFTAKDATSGADVSAGFRIDAPTPDAYGPAWFVAIDGLPVPMPLFTVTSGYASVYDTPAGITDFVFRAGSWMYENREQANMPGVDQMNLGNSWLTGYWAPRC
jgi:hypothetical protein